jgi:hypothetical protein
MNRRTEIAIAACLTLGFYAAGAQAEPPAASVKITNDASSPVPVTGTIHDADAPGRTPYSTRSQILPAGGGGGCFNTSDCSNYSGGSTIALFDLPTVPAGKRWVVVAASGGLTGGSPRINQIELLNNRGGIVFDGLKWIFAGPFGTGVAFSSAVYSQELFATFEPGETPSVRVSSNAALGYSVIVFHGYLVDATP